MNVSTWVYVAIWISGTLSLVYSAVLLISVVKIWRLLEEIISSGAIPIVLEKRAKRDAQRILRVGYVEDHKQFMKICQVLSGLRKDQEAAQLLLQLEELQKTAEGGEVSWLISA